MALMRMTKLDDPADACGSSVSGSKFGAKRYSPPGTGASWPRTRDGRTTPPSDAPAIAAPPDRAMMVSALRRLISASSSERRAPGAGVTTFLSVMVSIPLSDAGDGWLRGRV